MSEQTTDTPPEQLLSISLRVNGVTRTASAPARRLLSDFLRHDLGLTGTHVGCEHGVCGACTVLVDGQPMRACLMFAVSAQRHEVTTIEGIGNDPEKLSPVQQAFTECHALQCGFCTPGFVTTITAYLEDNPDPTPEEAREAISGNLCRCTGYQNIVGGLPRRRDPSGPPTVPRSTRSILGTTDGRARAAHEHASVRRARPAPGGPPSAHRQRPLPRRPRARGTDRRVRAQPARPRADRRHRHRRRVGGRRRRGHLHVGGPDRPGRRAVAGAHPAPGPDSPAHRLLPGQGRGQPRRRGDRHGHRPRPLPRRGRCPADPGDLRQPARRRRRRAARAAQTLVHDDAPGNIAAHLLQEVGDVTPRWPPRRTPSPSTSRSSAARACRWRARASSPAGTPTSSHCASTPRRRPRRGCGRLSPPSWGCRSRRSSALPPTSAAGSA
jgi:carbon-monoxide dehydrogenase small subunit